MPPATAPSWWRSATPSNRAATRWPTSTTSRPAIPTSRRCCASNGPTCSASPLRRRPTRRSRSWPPVATPPRPSCARRPWPATWARRAPCWRPATSSASSWPSGIKAAGCGPTSRRATPWRPAISAHRSSPESAAPSAALRTTSHTPLTACCSCSGSPRWNGCWATCSASRTAGNAAGPAKRWLSGLWASRAACAWPWKARRPRRPASRRTPTSSWAPTGC